MALAEISGDKREPVKQKEIGVGSEIRFNLEGFDLSGARFIQEEYASIERLARGGFHGAVCISEKIVLKGSYPSSKTKEFLRYINWRGFEFPPSVKRDAADLGYLAAKILHLTIPTVTDGVFYSPDVYGSTQVNGQYYQVIERVSGRAPKYLPDQDEFPVFLKKQGDLNAIEAEFGFEISSQISPKNPKGMPNFIYDEENKRWIQRDVHAAFQLLPFLGFIYFGHEKDILERFYPNGFDAKTPPFNRFHTEIFRTQVNKFREKFTSKQYEEILSLVNVYELIQKRYEEKYSPEINLSKVTKCALLAGKEMVVDLFSSVPSAVKDMAIGPILAAVNPKRQRKIILAGIREAHTKGNVTDLELFSVEQNFEEKNLTKEASLGLKAGLLYGYYFGLSRATNIAEGLFYINQGLDPDFSSFHGFLFSVGSGIWEDPVKSAAFWTARASAVVTRPLGTYLLEKITKLDYRVARRVSAIPGLGDNLAPPTQCIFDLNSGSEIVNHYNIRKWGADFTEKLFIGGWNTNLEYAFYKLIGRRIENWVKPK